jgi:aryl-alcohol dehydrogenase-like predicted oxidoreductase
MNTNTPNRTLGRSGIVVSPMGFGCWAIGGPFWAGDAPLGWGEVDDEESIRALHAAFDRGITFYDTASVYGAGHSERVLGRAFADRRDKVVLCTKFGPQFDESSRQVTGGDKSPEGIRRSCEESLRRLGTDHLDLLLFHFNDHPVDDAADVRETLEALTKEGKIRTYGWSTDFPDRAEFFAEGEGCAAIELELNVLDDNPKVVEICERENLAAINRQTFAGLRGEGGGRAGHPHRRRTDRRPGRAGLVVGPQPEYGSDPGHPDGEASRGKRRRDAFRPADGEADEGDRTDPRAREVALLHRGPVPPMRRSFSFLLKRKAVKRLSAFLHV